MRVISIQEEGMTYTKIHDKLKQRKKDKGKLERVERNRKYIFVVKLQYVEIQSQSIFVSKMLSFSVLRSALAY